MQENVSSDAAAVVREEVIVQEYPHPLFSISAIKMSPNPEVCAALGAQQSRSPASLVSRAGNLTEPALKRIIGKYFKKYGHNSVGEMGTLFLSIEGISMIAALRVIDTPLFRGQEASTRYMSFKDPSYSFPELLRSNREAHEVVRENSALYNEVFGILFNEYIQEGMEEKDARPRAFDVAGAFLPGAIKTSVVFVSDIRTILEQAWKLQSRLDNSEVCSIAAHLLEVVDDQCPNSVNMEKSGDVGKFYKLRKKIEKDFIYSVSQKILPTASFAFFDNYSYMNLQSSLHNAALRRTCMHETALGHYGSITVYGCMSLRSLRDIWRHRPFSHLFTHTLDFRLNSNFADWYLEEIPEKSRDSVTESVNNLINRACKIVPLEDSSCDEALLYLLPMGCQMRFKMTGTIDKWLYFLNLRSGVKVHPEVRKFVLEVTKLFQEQGIICSVDESAETDYGKRSEDG